MEWVPSISRNLHGFSGRKKLGNPNTITNYCLIHRWKVVSKAIDRDPKSILEDVIEMINFIRVWTVKCRLFEILCKGMGADHYSLLIDANVRCLSKGIVRSRLYELRDELSVFSCNQLIIHSFFELLSYYTWCHKLTYLVNIFKVLNALSSNLQGKVSNILCVIGKQCAFLHKLQIWSYEI